MKQDTSEIRKPEYIKVNETKAQSYIYAIDTAHYWDVMGKPRLAQDSLNMARWIEGELESIVSKITGVAITDGTTTLFFDMQVEEIRRLSEDTLEEDIKSLIEECGDTVESTTQETRNKIEILQNKSASDLVNELAEFKEWWDR